MDHIAMIRAATQVLIDHADELTELDRAIGDGDHGLNMRRGANAIRDRLDELAGMTSADALKAVGMTCMSSIGGSSGPVFGTLALTLARELPADPGPAEVSAALDAGIKALTRLGKAEVGQKTLLDVLDPVRRLLLTGGEQMPARIGQCALDSALATADIEATRGRASFLGERARGHVDPGSRSMALIICAVCNTL